MTQGQTEGAARAPFANGFTRNVSGMTLEQRTAEWSCTKRDDSVVSFDVAKIRAAVRKCFMNAETTVENPEHLVDLVVGGVVNHLAAEHRYQPSVEDVQRLVIAQLWTNGLYDEAEHYQNYREERRKTREEQPIDPAHAARVAEDQQHFPTDLQYYQYMSKFSRWNEDESRRETWRETCDRVIDWFKSQTQIRGRVGENDWRMLWDAMYDLKASPAMRVVQMAGPALDRCNMGVYNCCYHPLEDLFGFSELLYNLMQGCGNAFSVEADYVSELPRVKKQKGKPAETYRIDDSTEGWCDALHLGLQRWWDGHDVNFDASGVRPANARLRTKGGRASGPGPLLKILDFARSTILARQGSYLVDLDVHDIACVEAESVQVGGVRRASCLSASDLNSPLMRHAKSGNWFDASSYRRVANNSAVFEYDGPPPVEIFMEEWLSLLKSKSGERGIFNRRAAQIHKPKRRKLSRFGTNPCAEIILRPYGLCNLSIAIARFDDTIESLRFKVMIATIFGIMQSTCTKFRYVRDTWRKNAEEERLLGVDITGHADCPLLRFGAPGRDALLRELREVVRETKRVWSPKFDINDSAADTTVKPSGDAGVFFNAASGVSPRFAAHQIRWVTEPMGSPVARFLKDSGVPCVVSPGNSSNYLFGFPLAAPEGSTLRNDMTAVEQLENWLEWKTEWAEHSVSATIYIGDDEWFDTGAWVYKHFDQITGLAFLPRDNGNYKYAPNEEVTPEQYHEMVERFPDLRWEKLAYYETEDMTEAAQTLACTSGACSRI